MRRPRIPISARILVLNVLLVFVPIAAFLSLDSYEKSLLESLEDSLVQQGRILAAWLSDGPLTAGRSTAVLSSLGKRHTARLRVIDPSGRLLADSSTLGAEGLDEKSAAGDSASLSRAPAADPGYPAPGGEASDVSLSVDANPVYRFFSSLVRLYRRFFAAPDVPLPSADFYAQGRNFLEGPEIRAALEGRYGAATRISAGGQVSVTLYSALPIAGPGGHVNGVALVSQSTYRILTSLYRLRLDVARIFLFSLTASVALSILLWLTISRPLSRLAARARSALTLPSLAAGHFGRAAVSDEIDDLAGALGEFSSRLAERLGWAEDFAADLAHELRNPLASIRASAELVDGAGADEARLLAGRIVADCDRMNRIVGGLRELSRIESEESEDPVAEVLDCARNSAERAGDSAEARGKGLRVLVVGPEPDAPRRASIEPGRLVLALGALLDNAVSFSPEGGTVELLLEAATDEGLSLAISVLDRGKGLPPGDADRVFDRFFTTRAGLPAGGTGRASGGSPATSGGLDALVSRTPDSSRSTRAMDASILEPSARGGSPGGAQGTHCGLGLAIVRGIVLRAGGRVEAADRPGGGARFTIYLRGRR